MATKNENEIKPAEGCYKTRKRVGRGNASGFGGECGRGHKGQKSRSGFSRKPGFEGGQNPLYRRIPKKRGFKNPFKTQFAPVNVGDLDRLFKDGDTVDLESLYESGLVRLGYPVKLLADGELSKKLTISVHKASKSAIEKCQASGSTVEILG